MPKAGYSGLELKDIRVLDALLRANQLKSLGKRKTGYMTDINAA